MKKIWKNIKRLFPEDAGAPDSANLFMDGLKEIKKRFSQKSFRLYFNSKTNSDKNSIFNKIPEEGLPPQKIIKKSIHLFFNKIPLWRSSKNQYNICAPTNTASVALMILIIH